MSSIIDVAKLAGVSIATVSRYVNTPHQVKSSTAKKVENAIKQTGYQRNTLARNFRTGKTFQVMVVLPAIGVPFYGPIVDGVRKVADENGYHLLVMETAHNSADFDDFTRLLMQKQADGLILLTTLSPFKETKLISDGTNPHIVLGLENIASGTSLYPCVSIDNEAAARDATQYLIDLGHRDIGFLYGNIGFLYDSPYPESESTKARLAGYRKAMEENQLAINEDWIVKAPMSSIGGQQAAQKLLTNEKLPTAIFCANDEIALGALSRLEKGGVRVPDDMSVIGLDNIRYGQISNPPLTTIEQPAQLIGEQSMRRLLRMISGEAVDGNNEILPHKLIVRNSTAPPKK